MVTNTYKTPFTDHAFLETETAVADLVDSIPTAPAVAGAYYQRNGLFRTQLPLENTPYERKR